MSQLYPSSVYILSSVLLSNVVVQGSTRLANVGVAAFSTWDTVPLPVALLVLGPWGAQAPAAGSLRWLGGVG